MPSDEWVGIIHTTKPQYMKGASDLTIRSRLILALAERKGRFEYNQSGDSCKWQLEFSQPPVETHADGGVINFSNHDAFRQVEIDWRGYIATDVLTMKQNAMNKGDNALINLFQTKANRLTKALRATFSGELYKDGEAAGRTDAIHGIETFCGAGTVAATDRVAQPSDTYGLGSLSTALGNQGGVWSADLTTKPNSTVATDWPDGSGDSEYDYASPKLVNWSANNWGTGATTWESNAARVISQTITWLTVTSGPDGTPDICVMSPNLFQGYKNSLLALRQVNVPHKEAQDLGFGNVLNHDGVAIQADFDCPVNTAYMINLSSLTISSLFGELFWMKGPDIDPRSAWSWLWGQGFYGNAKWQPKYVAKIKNYA